MTKQNFGLVGTAKDQLVKRFLARRDSQPEPAGGMLRLTASNLVIPEKFCRFDKFPGYERIALPEAAARKLGIENPYFKVHQGAAGATALIDGKTYLNFSSYNYLGLAGDPRVNQAAKDAIDRYGTSASASRLVAGERPIQRELEQAIASLYEVDDCVVFVSGHATNVTTISTLFGPRTSSSTTASSTTVPSRASSSPAPPAAPSATTIRSRWSGSWPKSAATSNAR